MTATPIASGIAISTRSTKAIVGGHVGRPGDEALGPARRRPRAGSARPRSASTLICWRSSPVASPAAACACASAAANERRRRGPIEADRVQRDEDRPAAAGAAGWRRPSNGCVEMRPARRADAVMASTAATTAADRDPAASAATAGGRRGRRTRSRRAARRAAARSRCRSPRRMRPPARAGMSRTGRRRAQFSPTPLSARMSPLASSSQPIGFSPPARREHDADGGGHARRRAGRRRTTHSASTLRLSVRRRARRPRREPTASGERQQRPGSDPSHTHAPIIAAARASRQPR